MIEDLRRTSSLAEIYSRVLAARDHALDHGWAAVRLEIPATYVLPDAPSGAFGEVVIVIAASPAAAGRFTEQVIEAGGDRRLGLRWRPVSQLAHVAQVGVGGGELVFVVMMGTELELLENLPKVGLS